MLMDRAPYARGNIDTCHPMQGAGTIAGRMVLLPGTRVLVRGWTYEEGAPKATVSAIAAGRRTPLRSGIERLDIVPLHGLAAAASGFEGWIEGLETLDEPFELRVLARFGNQGEQLVGPAFAFIPTAKALSTIPEASGQPVRGRIRRLADTRPEPFPAGWTGRRSIRPGAAIEIAGWALDVRDDAPDEIVVEIAGRGSCVAFPTQRFLEGEATTVAGTGTSFSAGFRCVVDAGPFVPGLYDAAAIARSRDGIWRRGPATPFQIEPSIAEIAPILLPEAYQKAHAVVERLGPLDPLPGEPIAVAGWATDPANDRSGAVFVAFDDGHPLPIPSRISRPGVRTTNDDCVGFEGIADTTGLEPGLHRLRVLLQATSGALWHRIADVEVAIR